MIVQDKTAYRNMALGKVLGRMGFAQLTEPNALFDQIAGAITDHRDFSRLLDKCEPGERATMYRSLAGRLSFTPKPLDVYTGELAIEAERKQLPTTGPGGHLKAFNVQTLQSDDYVATQAVLAERAKHHLTVVCVKCTKEARFSGARKVDAIQALRNAGWTYDEIKGTGRELCPTCPGGSRFN